MDENVMKLNNQLNEIDGLLNEKEQSLKKKIFSLSKMESLVFSDPKLTSVYDEMSENGEEKYGYHYNETIMNMIFNDYVLNSSKYLQKYKMAIPKKKKRRDKSGINKLRHDSEKIDIPQQQVAETTSAGSAGGAAGYVGYAGPAAWAKGGEPMRKPLYVGGTVVGESENYLTEAAMFKDIVNFINEQFGIDEPEMSQKSNVEPYTNPKVNDKIIDKTSAFSSDTVKQWNKPDTELELNTVDTHTFDKPNLSTESVSPLNENMEHLVQYDSDRAGENPFMLGGIKWQYVNAIYPDGKKDIGVYRYGHDLVYDYDWFRKLYIDKEPVDEKAVSKAQQRFMGMVHGVQTGEIPSSKVGGSVAKAAKSMKADDVEDFASTKHDKLPEKIDEKDNFSNEALAFEPTLSKMMPYIKNIDHLADIMKAFIRGHKIYDRDLALQVVALSKKLFDQKQQTITEVSMIDHNETSMRSSDPIDAQGSGVERGMMGGGIGGGMNEEIAGDPKVQKLVDLVNQLIAMAKDSDGDPIGVIDTSGTWQEPFVYSPIIYRNGQLKITSTGYDGKTESEVILKRNMEYDGIPTLRNIANLYKKAIRNYEKSKNNGIMEDITKENNLDEMLNELNNLSEQHNKLVNMTEDRKPSALVLKDRLGNDNAKNFKADLQHSGTKKTIDIEKELQYADQQTTVGDNPYKNGEDIERKVSEKALENVGDSTSDGKHIPKRNFTEEEANEVDDYRLGLGDVKFDNEVGEKYENRMKTDMGDDFYAKRQRRLEVQANQPMYNKDTQPTDTEKGKPEDISNKFKQNLGEGTMVTGRYYDNIGKSHMIDFVIAEAKIVENAGEGYAKINLDGLGNTYANKLNSDTNKLEINENVSDVIGSYSFYLKEGNVFAVKNRSVLNENHEKNVVSDGDINKMKRLLGYKPSDFVNTKGNTRI